MRGSDLGRTRLAGEPLLTQRQAAEYLNVSITTLQRWRRKGIGPPSIRLPNGYLRFRRSDLDTWLEKHGSNPEGE
jgi:excisionase family DNA binding protein